MKERTAMAETNILRGEARPRLARVLMANSMLGGIEQQESS